jgi:hypothetical protein
MELETGAVHSQGLLQPEQCSMRGRLSGWIIERDSTFTAQPGLDTPQFGPTTS